MHALRLDLNIHLKKHSGEKPNKCNHYNYAFSEAGNLRRHLKTHSGEKSNKCNQKCIGKFIVEKRQTNANCATLDPHRQAIWVHVWKSTVEKSHTNAISVIINLCVQKFWGDIWKHTEEKSQTNAANSTMQCYYAELLCSVTMHPLG